MPTLEDEMAAVLSRLEGSSQRAIARQSGISPTLLNWIVRGKRRATPEVARQVAAALEYWAREYMGAAGRIRRAAKGTTRRGK